MWRAGDTSAQGPGQDEGVNTVDESGPAEEAEDVIGSYTAADADPAQVGAHQYQSPSTGE